MYSERGRYVINADIPRGRVEYLVYVIVISWVVGVYQNKCRCHEGAARAFISIFSVSNHGTTILYPD